LQSSSEFLEDFINKNNLKEDIIFLISKFKEYLEFYKINYDISLDIFRDYFNKNWSILRLNIKLKDVQDYVELYLFNHLREVSKTILSEDKRKKVIIYMSKDG
jgi:hypothetical protein